MSQYASTIFLNAARLVTEVKEGTSTGGTLTTLVDTAVTEPDGYFTGGAIWFLGSKNTAKVAAITDYDLPTTTFTFATQSEAMTSGNRYACVTKDYPRQQFFNALNEALKTIGSVELVNTALSTIEDEEDYALPSGVYNVTRLRIAQDTAEPYDWQENFHWKEIAGTIKFDPGHLPPETGYLIELTYVPLQITDITASTELVSDLIHPDLIKWIVAANLLRWRAARTDMQDPAVIQKLNEALRMEDLMKQNHPIPYTAHTPHFANW